MQTNIATIYLRVYTEPFSVEDDENADEYVANLIDNLKISNVDTIEDIDLQEYFLYEADAE